MKYLLLLMLLASVWHFIWDGILAPTIDEEECLGQAQKEER